MVARVQTTAYPLRFLLVTHVFLEHEMLPTDIDNLLAKLKNLSTRDRRH